MPSASPSISPQAAQWRNQLSRQQLLDSLRTRTVRESPKEQIPYQRPTPLPPPMPSTRSSNEGQGEERTEEMESTREEQAALLQEQKQAEAMQRRLAEKIASDPLNGAQRQVLDSAKKEGGRILRGALNVGGDGAGATMIGLLITATIFVCRGLITNFTFLRESRFGEFLAFQGRGIQDFVTYLEPTPKIGTALTFIILACLGLGLLMLVTIIIMPFVGVIYTVESIRQIPGISYLMDLIQK